MKISDSLTFGSAICMLVCAACSRNAAPSMHPDQIKANSGTVDSESTEFHSRLERMRKLDRDIERLRQMEESVTTSSERFVEQIAADQQRVKKLAALGKDTSETNARILRYRGMLEEMQNVLNSVVNLRDQAQEEREMLARSL